MTTRSGQIILKFSIEWSKVVFVRLSSLISEQGASFENQWSVHLEKLPVEWSSGRWVVNEWSQVVKSGQGWIFWMWEAIKHQNRSSEPSSSTSMTTRSGQIMIKRDLEWSRVVFIRVSGRRPKPGTSFESPYLLCLFRKMTSWVVNKWS